MDGGRLKPEEETKELMQLFCELSKEDRSIVIGFAMSKRYMRREQWVIYISPHRPPIIIGAEYSTEN